MPLKKIPFDVPAADGLGQKIAPQRLPIGKSASAINMVKNKAGRLEKRLGLYQLPNADPFGSGYTITNGVAIGTTSGGAQGDNLLVVGRGARPNLANPNLATSLQTFSDDLGGWVLRGPAPDVRIAADQPLAASAGSVVSPACAKVGDFLLTVWLDTAATFASTNVEGVGAPAPQPPNPPVGTLMWAATEVSTGQLVAGPAQVDAVIGAQVQYVRIAAVGSKVVVCYSVVQPNTGSGNNAHIYCKTMDVSVLTGTSGLPDWTPNQTTQGTSIVSNNFANNQPAFPPFVPWSQSLSPGIQAGCFDMVAGDDTYFLLAYQKGHKSGDARVLDGVVVDKRPASSPSTLTAQYTSTIVLEGEPYVAFGLCGTNVMSTGHGVLAMAFPQGVANPGDQAYVVQASAFNFSDMSEYNAPGIIYTAADPYEAYPLWLDVARCTAFGAETYVESHSPGGCVWNPALRPAGGSGATWPAQASYGGAGPFVFGYVQSIAAPSPAGINYKVGDPIHFTYSGGSPTFAASAFVGSIGPGGQVDSIIVNSPGSFDPSWTVSALVFSSTGSGAGAPAVTTTGGVALYGAPTTPGSGYSQAIPVPVTVSGGSGSGVVATAIVNTFGQITGVAQTQFGSGYSSSDTGIVQEAGGGWLAGVSQTDTNRLALPYGAGFTAMLPSNSARIIQNQFQMAIGGLDGPVERLNQTCGGDQVFPGTDPQNQCVTPGLVLASRGLEANGIVYYLAWIPSLTQGSFQILAFDVAAAAITSAGLSGNGFAMRVVGTLQSQTALADPGVGFLTLGFNSDYTPPTGEDNTQTTTGPNTWTGGSPWLLDTDPYASSYVAYVTSATQGERLSPAYGIVQTTPWGGYPMAQWGTTTAIGGALPSIFDGQNVFEQGFLYTGESILAYPASFPFFSELGKGGQLKYAVPTDTYSWIFTWEQQDAAGNFHISARSAPVTISGQQLLDMYGPYGFALSNNPGNLPWTGAITFRVPTLGATNRMWPVSTGGPAAFDADLRAFSQPPSGPVILGVYRSSDGGQTYQRVYDRMYNGDDFGDPSFTLGPPVQNTWVQNYEIQSPPYNSDAYRQIGWVEVTDGLSDDQVENAVIPFPDLYNDGTNGAPGNLDNFAPPATDVMVRHKERLFVASGNFVQFTKVRTEAQGPGYNSQVNGFFVGDDDPIVAMASTGTALVILKGRDLYYVLGDGPDNAGNGQAFGAPQPIPTDAGCISGASVISTPEGVYYMSQAGLRLVTPSFQIQYVGGPVEDELNEFSVVTGAVLHPSANRLILCANQLDYPVGGLPTAVGELSGELVVRDYFLDAWTTAEVTDSTTVYICPDTEQVCDPVTHKCLVDEHPRNCTPEFREWGVGFVNGAVARAFSSGTTAWSPTVHFLAADGMVWREHNPLDNQRYFDHGLGTNYVTAVWTSPVIKRPGDASGFNDQGRFRLYDIVSLFQSPDPHGLVISVAVDYGAFQSVYTWAWDANPGIAPGGTSPTPLTQVRSYFGGMGEAFQIQVEDVQYADTETGQGPQVLGLSLSLGVMPGPYKVPSSSTQ